MHICCHTSHSVCVCAHALFLICGHQDLDVQHGLVRLGFETVKSNRNGKHRRMGNTQTESERVKQRGIDWMEKSKSKWQTEHEHGHKLIRHYVRCTWNVVALSTNLKLFAQNWNKLLLIRKLVPFSSFASRKKLERQTFDTQTECVCAWERERYGERKRKTQINCHTILESLYKYIFKWVSSRFLKLDEAKYTKGHLTY